jgi:D-galactarolactone cycloisomerase
MKVTDVKVYPLVQPLDISSFAFSQTWVTSRQVTIVVISTDEGIQGCGEAFGPAMALARTIDTFCAPRVIGMDPFNTEIIWDSIYRPYRHHSQKGMLCEALSAVDIALWDIKGKATGQPVYNLLGGAFRDRAHAYATGLYRPMAEDPKSALVDEALTYKDQGFFAMKYKIGTVSMEEDLDILGAIRDAIGWETTLLVDANCAYDSSEAIWLARELEDMEVYWFEEALPPEDLDGYVELKNSTTVRIAAGECEMTRFGFKELIHRRCVDILQPDVGICGGITEFQKIVAMASAWNTQIVPHVWGTNVAIAAALQCYAAIPHIPGKINPPEPFFEFDRSPNPLRDGATHESFVAVDSYIEIPRTPGLGVTVDTDFLEAHAAK